MARLEGRDRPGLRFGGVAWSKESLGRRDLAVTGSYEKGPGVRRALQGGPWSHERLEGGARSLPGSVGGAGRLERSAGRILVP